MDRFGEQFVGLANYAYVFTDRAMLLALQNTLLWVIVGTFSCISLGLLIAILIDRCSYERFAKLLIFMPIAVSFVGASVIWRFVYAYNPGDQTQIGLLNAIVVYFGGEPKAWITMLQPWNNFFLMIILIWMMTGFAMVMFSAAIKDVPNEILEAARVDGASEVRSFFVIIIPYIKGTIVAVTTSITIFSMRVFDAVWVMTGGQYGTDVIGTVFYKEYFTFNN
ncbi:MAG: sugar ABC transporter permease [Bacillaceae bacterium]|nr:sugar ABC transporter permease [Bacillaceae bacterium]